MKKNLLLSLALSTVCATAVQAQTTLFETTNTSTPYRIPAITTAKNGHIIAISDYRLDKKDIGYGEVDMYARISTDNGSNWGSATLIADGTGTSGSFDCGFGDAAIVADRERNEILVMCVAGNQVFTEGTSSKHNHMGRIKATYNETEKKWEWTSPADVTEQFLGETTSLLPNAYTMFIASGRMVQSSYKAEGSSYYRVYAALIVKDSSSSTFKNYVIYTDDFGTSWSLLKNNDNSVAISGGDEAKVEELPNGDIVISSRTAGGRIFNVYSNDNWNAKPVTYTFANGAEACNGEIMLYKDLYKVGETTGQTYDVLLQSLPTASSRGNLKVFYQAVSKNTTLSTLTATGAWSEGKIVDSGNAAYSTMTIQTDKKIGFLYEDNYSSAGNFFNKWDYANIVYIPYTIEELTGNTYTTTAPVVSVDPTISLTAAATTLTVGETTQLTLTTNSDGAVSYTSSNTAVATVSADGVVTAKTAGTVTITANVAATANYNSASATVTITVNAPVVTPVTPTISLTAAATTLTVGGTTQLTATTNSDGAVTYTSSDESVATVSADGVVTAKTAGTVTITANVAATANYNAASATVTITVESNEGGNEGEETSTYEVTAVGGKIGSVSYYIATFSAPVATIVPSGVKAYYVKVGGSDVVTLTRISSGKVIPANQGVILISSTQTFIMTSTTDASNVADLTGNLMEASLNGVIPTGSYVLAVKGSGDLAGQFAFCLTSSELKLEKGNRAYLNLPSNAPQMRMRIEDESTDIEESAQTSDEAPVIYDLTGRRVTEMLPGRIYIVNGKKIVN